VPTRNDDEAAIRIAHLFHSLLFQTHSAFRVIVRDEGKVGIFSCREVRQFVDLLAGAGIELIYRRISPPAGIAVGRRELVHLASPDQYVCFVDDDMCLHPRALEALVQVAQLHPDCGFVQGQKIEADPNRAYWNDINRLNGRPTSPEPFPIYFGDTALLLLRASALESVNWDIITRYQVEGLTGEDIALSIMIADKFSCFGQPSAMGYHLSPPKSRWIWEAPSDLLQLELLKGQVRCSTLRQALPHLIAYIPEDGF
jgi:glycosyltransferase involved in cell wall biosynthesis